MTKLIKHKNTSQFETRKLQLDMAASAFDVLADSTKAGYTIDKDTFDNFVNKPYDKVTPSDIVDYFRFLQSKNYANATINRKMASISKLFKVYVTVGMLKVNPVDMAKTIAKLTSKTIRTQRSALSLQQVQDCVNAKDIHLSDMHCKYVIKFMAKTGMRVSEALNVRFKDISDIDGTYVKIKVLGKGKVERSVYIDRASIEEIRAMFKHETLLFCNKCGGVYSRNYMWRLVRDRFKRTIGVHNVKNHSMRHFYGTYKIAVEKRDIHAVSLALGHADPSTTVRFYDLTTLDAEDSQIKI